MAREHFLCSAIGSRGGGIQRRFTVFKVRGRGFKIYNDNGHSHVAGSLPATERDIINEIITVYDVSDVVVEGVVQQGVLASTWPLNCQCCTNCGCQPIRRRYGGRFLGQGFCVSCLGVVERKEAATKWNRDDSNTWSYIYLDRSTIVNSYSAEQFEVYRNEFIRQADVRLSNLREIESKRQGLIQVGRADIEELRLAILKGLRRNASLSSNDASLKEDFSAEQWRILYIKFVELTENIQWRFPWWEGGNAVYRHLSRQDL
jgi:hypothetical protein